MAVWTWAFGHVGGASEERFLHVGPTAPGADAGRKFWEEVQAAEAGAGSGVRASCGPSPLWVAVLRL